MKLHRCLIPRTTIVCTVVLLVACATQVENNDWQQLPALKVDSGEISAVNAAAELPLEDLLELDEEMEAFLDRYVRKSRGQRTRLLLLHQALRSLGIVGVEYDPAANGTAREAFHERRANCLSYANLFVALARAVGLRAGYQVVETKPEWDKRGTRLAVAIHVNAVVDLKNQERFEVDIDPLSRARIMGTRRISDREAEALHYNNIGMELFLEGDTPDAYRHLARALQIEPRLHMLWANIGAIYRSAGQHVAAEHSYQTALAYDSRSRTAMNNLAVLYQTQGYERRAQDMLDQIKRHRESNPYYHFQLAEAAEFDGDYELAIDHLKEAIDRKDSDAEFYYLLGRALHKAERIEESIESLELGMKKAGLFTQRERIRHYLQEVMGEAAM